MDELLNRSDKSKVSLNKRCCYLLALVIVVLPVVTGVVVWYITHSACDESDGGNLGGTNAPQVDGPSTACPTLPPAQPTAPPTTPPPSPDEPWKNLRLPHDVMPVHYDITLYPNFYGDNGWFYGNETADLRVVNPTKVILIHANYMNITRTKLSYENGEEIPIIEPFWYEENQFWVVRTESPLRVGMVKLELQFDGSLTRAIVGFYKSTYTNSQTNQIRHMASSKFQPVDARRAFPCMDEPNIKANYTISLVHQDGYIALSNMPNESTTAWEHDSTLKATKFQRSVPMSTYLVCFVVCDFAMLSNTTKYGTEIRVFATPDRIEQAAYSLHVMKMSMERFEDLFKVKFPLPKNDMIAIPNFVSGAMEHWGLITYREVNMLYDSMEASAANKQRVAVVVAHEIAHMWFGNIVTMDWWDDLWLNEGFASFVEYLGVDYTEPTWEMMDQMVVDDVKPVMVTDAGVNSHPIIVDVNHPDQINEVFDAISYSKGASIIRMLQEMMGSDAFFDGIAKYLVKYEWSTAKTDDLWTELGTVGPYSVKEVMDTWTLQMGLPLINVTFQSTGSGSRVTARQSRFLADRSLEYDENESPFRYRWYVQLDYIDDSSLTQKWIQKDQDQIEFDITTDMSTGNNLIKFNVNDTGFYRVNYPDDIWSRFATVLQTNGPNAIPFSADRTGLIDDAFNLARGGYLSYDVALQMTKYLDQELHHMPWDSAYNGITYIKEMFSTSGNFQHLMSYFSRKVRPVLDHLTWDDGDSHLDRLMRSNIITLACDFSDASCLENAKQRFRSWIANNTYISPNVRTYVYKYGMSYGGTETDWDAMWQKYQQETVPQERVKLLNGLANTKHIWLLNRYLEYSKNESLILDQDFFSVVTYISRNPVGNSVAWDWVRSNWQYLVNRFTTGSRSLGRLVPNIVSNYNTAFQLQQVREFFAEYPDAGAGARGREQAIESIERNIAWMERNAQTITNWLQAN